MVKSSWRRVVELATLARGKRWSLRHPSRGYATLVNLTAFPPSFETQGPVWLVRASNPVLTCILFRVCSHLFCRIFFTFPYHVFPGPKQPILLVSQSMPIVSDGSGDQRLWLSAFDWPRASGLPRRTCQPPCQRGTHFCVPCRRS